MQIFPNSTKNDGIKGWIGNYKEGNCRNKSRFRLILHSGNHHPAKIPVHALDSMICYNNILYIHTFQFCISQ